MRALSKEQSEMIIKILKTNLLPIAGSKAVEYIIEDLGIEGLIKEEFEVGKWYKLDDDERCLVFYSDKSIITGNGYGFRYTTDSEWREGLNIRDTSGWTPATDKEVETALIKEAKKRGFKEGVNIRAMFSDGKDYNHYNTIDEGFSYVRGALFANGGLDGYRVFVNGKWATTIEETVFREKTTEEILVDLDKIIEAIRIKSN